MAEVTGQAQLGQCPQQLGRDPGMKRGSTAVGLEAELCARFLGELQRAAEEVDGNGQLSEPTRQLQKSALLSTASVTWLQKSWKWLSTLTDEAGA